MTKRKVTGHVKNLQELPEIGVYVHFDFMKYSAKNDTYFITTSSTVQTDQDGYFEKELWCNEEGDYSTYYVVRIGDSDPIQVVIPVGTTPITLAALQQGGITQTSPQFTTLLTYVQQNIGQTKFKERFDVTSAIVIANGVQLTNPIALAHLVLVYLNGIQQSFGFDFNINNQKVNISGIGVGDVLEIYY